MQIEPNQTNKNDSDNRSHDEDFELAELLCPLWLGWRDSNPRIHGPEPCALPLGHIPLTD